MDARLLSTEEARDVLKELIQRKIAVGGEIVGWKIGRLPANGADDFFFTGPVFADYDQLTTRLVAPRVEVEFVARLDDRESDGSWRVSWHVGLEIVDNHDRNWCDNPAWCLADWALHAGATLGDACHEPRVGDPVDVNLVVGERQTKMEGRWLTGETRMLAILERDCAQLVRPCRAGDLVWSGALLPSEPLPIGAHVRCSVRGFGRTAFL